MLGLAEDYERQENSYVSNNNHSSMDYTHWFVMDSVNRTSNSHPVVGSSAVLEL